MTKRVLLISPYFPPHNTIGTKRAVNFVQGVHGQEGWEVIVLASKSFNNQNDFSLNDQIPVGVKVDYGFVGIFRPIIQLFSGSSKEKKVAKRDIVSKPKKPKAKQSKSLTPFDQYVWDVKSAIRSGKRLIESYKPDVIWVNADPWSGFLVANALSKKFDIPWVADLRDPWTIFEKKMETRPSLIAKIIAKYESQFFKSAEKVVLNTKTACDAYKKVYPSNYERKFTFIRNAFNEKILFEEGISNKEEKFIFGYYGGFRRFVPSDYILKGYSTFINKSGLSPNQVGLEVRGNVYADFWDQVNEYKLGDYVKVEKEIKQSETVAHLRTWDVLLLSAVHDFRWMVSAKFYDYLFIRKPILAVSDNEELNNLIEKTVSGRWANTQQSDKIVELFEDYYIKGKTSLLSNESLIEPFGFEYQANRFRQTLEEVLIKEG